MKLVKSFCYLKDRLYASGGNEASVTAKTKIGLFKFRECGELLNVRKFSFKIKGLIERIHRSCERSTMFCGSET